MSLRLHKLSLQDFKGLEGGPYDVTIENDSLFFLSGPNGYGKTTIFEAIELCLTGKVSRIEESIKLRKEHALINHNASPLHNNNNPFIVRLELSKDGDRKVIEVSKSPKSQPLSEYNQGLEIKFYGAEEQGDRTSNRGEIDEWLDFDDNLYRLFIYMSQDDSVFFLRQRQSDRHSMLNPLLDTSAHNEDIEKIQAYYTTLGIRISELENTLPAKINPSKNQPNPTGYTPLFPWIPVDSQPNVDRKDPYGGLDFKQLDVQNRGYNEELKSISEFLEHFDFDEYKKYQRFAYFSRPLRVDDFSLRLAHAYILQDNQPEIETLNTLLKIANASLARRFSSRFICRELLNDETIPSHRNDYYLFNSYHDAIYEEDSMGNFVDCPPERALRNLTQVDEIDEDIKQVVNALWSEYTSLDNANKTYNKMLLELQEAQDKLTSHRHEFSKANKEYSQKCLHCGHDWGSEQALLGAIEDNLLHFKSLDSTEAKRIQSVLSRVKVDLVAHIKQRMENLRLTHDLFGTVVLGGDSEIDESTFELVEGLFPSLAERYKIHNPVKLTELAELVKAFNAELRELVPQQKVDLARLLNDFDDDGQNYSSYITALSKEGFNLPDQQKGPESIEDFKSYATRLESAIRTFIEKYKYDSDSVNDKNINMFRAYIHDEGAKDELIKTRLHLVNENLSGKVRYINEQYNLKKTQQYSKVSSEISLLKAHRKRIKDSLLDKYQEIIVNFQNKITSALQIPFYIYSARILQNCPHGDGGLIIKPRADDDASKTIVFGVPNNSHDATNQLSSGQLVVVALAFFLAMNTIYQQNSRKLLLLDDPIQDMDSLNFHSFTDLMRREFVGKGYQVILSTTNDLQMNYMRYKFRADSDNVFNVQEKFFSPTLSNVAKT